MLATILKTKQAVEISIAIMDAFVAMRHFISKDLLNSKYVNSMLVNHEERRVYDINILNKILEQLKKATLVTSNLKW